MLASLIDGMNEGGANRRRAARDRRRGAAAERRRRRATATAPTSRPCSASSSSAGATSACCSRCPARASATPRSPRSPPRSSSSATGALGRDGDHRARGRLRLRRDPHHRRLDGDGYVLNGEKIYVTAGERADWSSSGRPSTAPRARRDQVLRRRALQPRPEARAPRAQARASAPPTPPRSASRTAACRRRHCSAAPRST